MEVTAVVAVVLSVIGGLVSAYAALRQRRTEDTTVVVGAMRDHMKLIGDENIDYRQRLHAAEQTISDLRVEVTRCEADKDQLKLKFGRMEHDYDVLKEQFDDLRSRVPPGPNPSQ